MVYIHQAERDHQRLIHHSQTSTFFQLDLVIYSRLPPYLLTNTTPRELHIPSTPDASSELESVAQRRVHDTSVAVFEHHKPSRSPSLLLDPQGLQFALLKTKKLFNQFSATLCSLDTSEASVSSSTSILPPQHRTRTSFNKLYKMARRYKLEELLHLRNSPLVSKPPNLPPIEEWMG